MLALRAITLALVTGVALPGEYALPDDGPPAARTFEAPPATRFHYSNFDFVLLGLVVEAVDGKPNLEVLRERVLAPAAMERIGVDDGRLRPGPNVAKVTAFRPIPARPISLLCGPRSQSPPP